MDFGVCIFCGNCVEYCPTNCFVRLEISRKANYRFFSPSEQ